MYSTRYYDIFLGSHSSVKLFNIARLLLKSAQNDFLVRDLYLLLPISIADLVRCDGHEILLFNSCLRLRLQSCLAACVGS